MAQPKQELLDARGVLQRWLQDSKDQGVIVLDRHGVILEWLAGAEEVLGFPAQEAVGHHIAMIFTHEDKAKGYPDHELRVAASDHYSEDSRWHVRRDGTRVWVTGSVSAVRLDGHQEVQGFVKVIRDVTDGRTHVERLENEIAALKAVQAEREVAGDAEHRESGQLQLTRTDLREVLNGVADAMRPRAEGKLVTIEPLMPPTALWVMADAARLRQVVVNLVGNAIKFNNRGGKVWLSATEEGDEVVCRVIDNGLGIFPPVLPRLFALFSHDGEVEAEPRRHGGAGLVLVRQLVELHGGTVQAKSAGLGKGAEFSFRLPRAAAAGSAR